MALILIPSLAAGLEVRVVDGVGNPVPNAEIEVRGLPRTEGLLGTLLSFRTEGTSDERGRAELAVPATAGLMVFVDREGYLPVATELACEASVCSFELGAGAPIVGRVVLADGADAGGTVCARWRESFAAWEVEKTWRRCADFGQNGRFRLPGVFSKTSQEVSTSPIDLEIKVPGYLPVTLAANSTKVSDVVLERGVLIRGRVVSAASGQPLENIVVRENRRPSDQSLTDADGRFELAVRSVETQLIAEGKLFHPRKVALLAQESGSEVEIGLDPREAVTGLVVVSGAEPVDQVRLFFERQIEGRTNSGHRRATPDREGRFIAHLPGAGRYGFRLSAEGLEARPIEPVQVAKGETFDLGVVELDPGARITGRLAIDDGGGGEGVAGAEVLIVDEGAGLMRSLRQRGAEREVTDANGEFEFAGLPNGAFQLRIRHQDHAARLERVTLDPGELLELGTLWLDRGRNLHGTVTNRKGEPQGGLRVELVDREQAIDLPVASAGTDQSGRFRGIRVHPGAYRLKVTGRRLLASQAVDVTEGEDSQEVHVTTNGVALSGRVVRDGVAVDGGWLTLSSALDPGHFRGKVVLHHAGRRTNYGVPESDLTVEVGSDGSFRLEDAPAGLGWATFADRGGQTVRRRVLIPDAAEARVEIEIAGVGLSGRVADAESDEGVAGALLKLVRPGGGLEAASTASRSDGSFSFSDLEAGSYKLQVAAEGYEAAARDEIEVRRNSPPIVIPVRRGASKRLIVEVRRENGAPAAGVMLTLLDASGLQAAALATDSTGRREFGRLIAGRYRLAWSDGLAGAGISGPIDLDGGEETQLHAEILPVGASLTVTCPAAECAGATVDYLGLYSEDGFEIAPYLSGVSAALRFSESGELPLGRLSRGRYLLRLGAVGREWRHPVEASGAAVSVGLE